MTKTKKANPESAALQAPVPQTKRAMVVALLSRPDGANLAEIVAATGWLAHTARAALTGLKKQGHVLTNDKVDGVRRYRIQEDALGGLPAPVRRQLEGSGHGAVDGAMLKPGTRLLAHGMDKPARCN